MKKYLVNSLMLGVFSLMLTGSAFAGIHDDGRRCNVPEPSAIALLSSGMAGIGLFNFIKRKNRK